MNWPAIIIVATVCCLLGGAIGSAKGQGGAGAILGLLLGPLGLLLCLTMKPTPAAAAAREEAIDAERAKLRAQRENTQGPAAPPPADS